MTTAVPAESKSYDDMATVFDDLVKDPPTPASESTDDKKVVASADPAAKADPASSDSADKTPSADAPADVGTTGEPKPDAGVPADGAEPSDATPKPAQEIDWKARFEELAAKVERSAEELAKPPVETPPADTKPAPLYTDDEVAAIKTFKEDWPDVYRGATLILRQEKVDLVNHIFSEFHRVYGDLLSQVAPVADTVAHTATLAAIRETHSDYNDAMYDGVVEWVDTLTGFEQRVAKQVIEEGDPEDVVDLITKYKEAKGLNKPRAVVVEKPATQAGALPDPVKKAAAALEVVGSKRSGTLPGVPDANDFDGAWKEAAGGGS